MLDQDAHLIISDAPTALIIEDDLNIIRLLQKAVEPLGWNIMPLMSVEEFSSDMPNTGYDMIILDYHIDGGTAIDALKHLKDTGAQCPIFLLSAAEKEVLDEAIAIGTDMGLAIEGYMQKPISAKQVRSIFSFYAPSPAPKEPTSTGA